MINKRTLKKAIRIAGNQSKLAEYLQVERQYISDIKHGRRPFPKAREAKLRELIGQ